MNLKNNTGLLNKLEEYGKSDIYPFHMPGHKRAKIEFPNPFQIDITEIEGFDNLHHPQGILKDAMEQASKIYGSDKSWFLVNGSSVGILSAVCGLTRRGGKIIMSRNCHKAVYHGVFLNELEAEYIYPQYIPEFGIQGGVLPEDVEKSLKKHPDTQIVLIVSPTFEGIVSDIKRISQIVHSYGIPLIVDEAHGAHFPFACQGEFPKSALDSGADVVIQSLHKTLPSFTQTAIIHWKKGYSDEKKIERYLQIYQSSSPSYLFIGGIDWCIGKMAEDKGKRLHLLAERLQSFRSQAEKFQHIRIPGRELSGKNGVYDVDLSKLVLSVKGTNIDGEKLSDLLRNQYHLEMEMCNTDYTLAMTSAFDREEGFERLFKALKELDEEISREDRLIPEVQKAVSYPQKACMNIYQAWNSQTDRIRIEDAEGKISGEFVYIYPPGIPVIVPGERLDRKIIEIIKEYKAKNLPVQGLKDKTVEYIETVMGE